MMHVMLLVFGNVSVLIRFYWISYWLKLQHFTYISQSVTWSSVLTANREFWVHIPGRTEIWFESSASLANW